LKKNGKEKNQKGKWYIKRLMILLTLPFLVVVSRDTLRLNAQISPTRRNPLDEVQLKSKAEESLHCMGGE